MAIRYSKLMLALISSGVILTGCNENESEYIYDTPEAQSVSVDGIALSGNTLTGTYTYEDPNQDINLDRPEGESLYEWHLSSMAQSKNDNIVSTELTFTIPVEYVGQTIYFCVTPVAQGEANTVGTKVCSSYKTIIFGGNETPTASDVAISELSTSTGDTLEGTYQYVEQEPGAGEATSLYVWKADGQTIEGESSQSIVLAPVISDSVIEGKKIQFCVTPVSIKPSGTPDEFDIQGDQFCSEPTSPVQAVSGVAPEADNVLIDGEAKVGITLSGKYTYDDEDGDPEGTSTFAWHNADDEIVANTQNYKIEPAQDGKTLKFCVTPIALTGVEKNAGVEVCSAETASVEKPVEPAPTLVIGQPSVTYGTSGVAKRNETVTGTYTLEDKGELGSDVSVAEWIVDEDGNTDDSSDQKTLQSCTAGSGSCDLTITENLMDKKIAYCVTPQLNTSDANDKECTDFIGTYGVVISGKLEFRQELKATVYGYNSPEYSWKLDLSSADGTTASPTEQFTESGVTESTYKIGKIVLDDASVTDQNSNGFIDDADWLAAKGDINNSKSIDDPDYVLSAAHYIGKDVEVCITSADEPALDECLLASAQPNVEGGVYTGTEAYDPSAPSDRGIEPVRIIEFGNAVYHRPLSAEEVANGGISFGKSQPIDTDKVKTQAGVGWITYFGGVEQEGALNHCLNLYEGQDWYLPMAAINENAFDIDGNLIPDESSTDYTLDAFSKLTANGIVGLIDGSVKSKKEPDGIFDAASEKISPTYGWPLQTPFLTSSMSDDSKTKTVNLALDGGLGTATDTTNRFVSCVKAK